MHFRHGAKVKLCSVDGCTNQTAKGGVCIRHGAIKKRKLCNKEGCTNQAIRGGVCIKHGAKVKLCSIDGCTTLAVKGGVCIKHGAKVKRCSYEGCINQSKRRGLCKRHGAYGNPLDESTAFALSHRSAHDETTATLPTHPIATASTNQERGRDPPSVIVCQVIDYVEV